MEQETREIMLLNFISSKNLWCNSTTDLVIRDNKKSGKKRNKTCHRNPYLNKTKY